MRPRRFFGAVLVADTLPSQDLVAARVRRWIERVVVAHNLCPFARRELALGSVRYCVSQAADESMLLHTLDEELALLVRDPSIETTLLIHPQVLEDFYHFNSFLGQGDRLLRRLGLEGVFQIASFHPRYQFAGTGPDDAQNYSNRSPYPMLHLLREDSVERAIAGYPDIAGVPHRNIATLEALGTPLLRDLCRSCLDD